MVTIEIVINITYIKYGSQGQSGQAINLFQEPRKISFTFHFWHKSFIFDDVKLAELSNNSFGWKNVTILGGGVKKHTLTPPTYFRDRQDPQPTRIYALGICGATMHWEAMRLLCCE